MIHPSIYAEVFATLHGNETFNLAFESAVEGDAVLDEDIISPNDLIMAFEDVKNPLVKDAVAKVMALGPKLNGSGGHIGLSSIFGYDLNVEKMKILFDNMEKETLRAVLSVLETRQSRAASLLVEDLKKRLVDQQEDHMMNRNAAARKIQSAWRRLKRVDRAWASLRTMAPAAMRKFLEKNPMSPPELAQIANYLLDDADHGTLARFKVVLEAGASPASRVPVQLYYDEGEWTLLHAVLARRSTSPQKWIEAVLEAGGNPNAVGVGGIRPLHMAAAGGSASVVKTLLDAGANVNAKNAKGMSPLLAATKPAIAKLLIERGANLERNHDDPKIAALIEKTRRTR
jgi:hypothetical protein